VEPDRVAHLESVEVCVQDAVPVEVDLAAVGRLDEAMVLAIIQPGDMSMGWRFVDLDPLVAPPGVVLETPARGIERVADGYVNVFVGVVQGRFPPDDDLAPGQGEIDPYVVQVPLMAVVTGFHNDPAPHDLVGEAL
jgi:hypothetical protein